MDRQDPGANPTLKNGPELVPYTIPVYSSWFRWDDIHETERAALPEFFDGTSITRTPKIYKEYRDFIINKYREDPSRRLVFTEVRKSLVADVNLLHKVFKFLDKWGLINFAAAAADAAAGRDVSDSSTRGGVGSGDEWWEREEIEHVRVRVEDGAPNGVRVVATPNSVKPVTVPVQGVTAAEGGGKSMVKLPPLASYSDVFGESGKGKKGGFMCGSCGSSCDSAAARYEYTKDEYLICEKCFKDEKYGEGRSKDDFKPSDNVDNGGMQGAAWTEAEVLLLLESVLRHGDDWDLVAQSVQTKTKLECISKLIELPFGDLILKSTSGRDNPSGLSGGTNGSQQVPFSSSENEDKIKNESELVEKTNVNELNGDTIDEGPPLKRQCIASLPDAGSSLMKQVSLIATVVGPDITLAAAEATVAALCDETSCPREIFDDGDDCLTNQFSSHSVHSEAERAHQVEDSEVKELEQSGTREIPQIKNDIPLSLRLRASIGTALGAAAARAKLLADQEDREIENLVAIIIEAQFKKLQRKAKYFDDLELITEKEYAELEELKESLIEDRIDVLRRAISAGITKWRDHSSVKSHTGPVF